MPTPTRPRRIAYDTEFVERAGEPGRLPTIDLVSVGLVNIDYPAERLYLISAEFDDVAFAENPWLVDNVLPHLPYRVAVAAARTLPAPTRNPFHPPATDSPLAGPARAVVDAFRPLAEAVRQAGARPVGLDAIPEHPDHRRTRSRAGIAEHVAEFVHGDGDRPVQLWADYAAYDHVALCWLFGRMSALPSGVPMFSHDVRVYASLLDVDPSTLPAHHGREHHALDDAEHCAERVRFLDSVACSSATRRCTTSTR